MSVQYGETVVTHYPGGTLPVCQEHAAGRLVELVGDQQSDGHTIWRVVIR